MISIGDNVKFEKLLSDDNEDWNMDPIAFNYIRQLVGQTGTVENVRKHYEDNGSKTFWIDVKFECGYILKSTNSIAFSLINN